MLKVCKVPHKFGYKFSQLQDYPRPRDQIIRGFSLRGNVRFSFIENNNSLQQAIDRFKLAGINEISVLGKCFSSSLLLSSLQKASLKNEERIKFIVNFFDRAKSLNREFYAESIGCGEIRGYAKANPLSNPDQRETSDFLRVGKILHMFTEEAVSGITLDIDKKSLFVRYGSEEFNSFFRKSEQILTFTDLHTDPAKQGGFTSVGFLVQKMPGAEDLVVEQIYRSIVESKFWNDLKQGESRIKVSQVKALLDSIDLTDADLSRYPVDYFCRCSKDNFKAILIGLGRKVIEDMREKNQNLLYCNFCNRQHALDEHDYEDLISKLE